MLKTSKTKHKIIRQDSFITKMQYFFLKKKFFFFFYNSPFFSQSSVLWVMRMWIFGCFLGLSWESVGFFWTFGLKSKQANYTNVGFWRLWWYFVTFYMPKCFISKEKESQIVTSSLHPQPKYNGRFKGNIWMWFLHRQTCCNLYIAF